MNKLIFQRAIMKYTMLLWIPFILLFLLLMLNVAVGRDFLSDSNWRIFGLPVIATNGTPNLTGFAGIGVISIGGLAVGLVAFGGLAVGLVAFGGGAIGLIAIGGGAVGLIAIGGGALGLIALGGGSAGIVAFGGGAGGYYVLAGGGWGKHVLSAQRQDPQAVRFFCKYLPALRAAFAKEEMIQLVDPSDILSSSR